MSICWYLGELKGAKALASLVLTLSVLRCILGPAPCAALRQRTGRDNWRHSGSYAGAAAWVADHTGDCNQITAVDGVSKPLTYGVVIRLRNQSDGPVLEYLVELRGGKAPHIVSSIFAGFGRYHMLQLTTRAPANCLLG